MHGRYQIQRFSAWNEQGDDGVDEGVEFASKSK